MTMRALTNRPKQIFDWSKQRIEKILSVFLFPTITNKLRGSNNKQKKTQSKKAQRNHQTNRIKNWHKDNETEEKWYVRFSMGSKITFMPFFFKLFVFPYDYLHK